MKVSIRLFAAAAALSLVSTGAANAQSFGGFPTVTKQEQLKRAAQNQKTASRKEEKDPSYLVVDSRAHGDDSYTSIQAAINDVAAGGVVVVLPGTYQENIVLTKSVNLQGDRGPGGQVRVMPQDSSRPCLTYNPEGTNDHALVSNIQFDFSQATFAPGEPEVFNKAINAGFASASPCISVRSGVFTMKEATVDGGNLHAGTMVEITGGTAFLERNEIRGGFQGVVINQEHPLWDRALLVDNVITNNDDIGLHLQGRSTMLVTGNMINANGRGITYNGEGGATMVGNKILNNYGDGVTLGQEAKQVLIRLNQIWSNEGDGLKIFQSNGLVEDNDIQGNLGVEISTIGPGNKPKIYNDVERAVSRAIKRTN